MKKHFVVGISILSFAVLTLAIQKEKNTVLKN